MKEFDYGDLWLKLKFSMVGSPTNPSFAGTKFRGYGVCYNQMNISFATPIVWIDQFNR